jgi:hypothetical protein
VAVVSVTRCACVAGAGVRALEEYIEHRMARVRQVSALLLGDGDTAECDRRLWTAEEVTRAIYAGCACDFYRAAPSHRPVCVPQLLNLGASLARFCPTDCAPLGNCWVVEWRWVLAECVGAAVQIRRS